MNCDWKYKNFGLVSNCEPHESPNIDFKLDNKRSLYYLWTENFDCNIETSWWYVIKDDIFDLNTLKAKRRYEINKGLKNFDVKVINPIEHLAEINEIRDALFSQYPDEYRTKNNPEQQKKFYSSRCDQEWLSIGAFKGNQLCGFLDVKIGERCLNFVRMCVSPKFEKENVNFALVYNMLENCKKYIEQGYYLCDGSRTIRHKTNFQDWLIKYFKFRKAYCILRIKPSIGFRLIINVLTPFNSILEKSHNPFLYKISTFLKIYKISKECEMKLQ